MQAKLMASLRWKLAALILTMCSLSSIGHSTEPASFYAWYEVDYFDSYRPDLHYMTRNYGGEVLELEDGSRYSVRSGDQWRVRRWAIGDPIFITPNHGYFFGMFAAATDMCLLNANTQETVEVNLSQGPFLYGPNSYWIETVDTYNGLIALGDGNILEVHPDDWRLLYNWDVYEHLLLGTNDGGGNRRYPFYIVNTASVTGVRARLL